MRVRRELIDVTVPLDATRRCPISTRMCETLFSVTRDTANRDFGLLLGMGLLRKVGRGRSTRYVLGEDDPDRQVIVR